MGSSDDRWSLDLIMRGGKPRRTLSVHGSGETATEATLFGSVFADANPSEAQPITLDITKQALSSFGMTDEARGEIVFLHKDQPTNSRITDFTMTSVIVDRYTIYSGRLDHGFGSNVDFVAVNDPAHLLAGAAILVGGCVVLGGFSVALKWAEMYLTGYIEKCKERDGIPDVDYHFGLTFKPQEFSFGCSFHPKRECNRLDGSPITLDLPESDVVPIDLTGEIGA
jgi:hypothetical protein